MVEHFFREQYGKLVGTLLNRVGTQHIEAVEDAVQTALLRAVESWPLRGRPDNPAAWLHRVAHNELLDHLRQSSRRREILRVDHAALRPGAEPAEALGVDVPEGQLRALLLCCDPRLPTESQQVMALKAVCGFSTREIAHRLLTTEANVHKRLERGRALFVSLRVLPTELTSEQIRERLPAVHHILYLLFTEGFTNPGTEVVPQRGFCREALRLTRALARHPLGASPASSALCALMLLHLARSPARMAEAGVLVLFEDQDRSRWDQEAIAEGLRWLARSAKGEELSRFHLEAGIAAEHCLAPGFAQTRWDQIADDYQRLEQYSPSPMHRLNRALAVAEARGAAAGLELLCEWEPPPRLQRSHYWPAVLADLLRRCGRHEEAREQLALALERAPESSRRLLEERFAREETAS